MNFSFSQLFPMPCTKEVLRKLWSNECHHLVTWNEWNITLSYILLISPTGMCDWGLFFFYISPVSGIVYACSMCWLNEWVSGVTITLSKKGEPENEHPHRQQWERHCKVVLCRTWIIWVVLTSAIKMLQKFVPYKKPVSDPGYSPGFNCPLTWSFCSFFF